LAGRQSAHEDNQEKGISRARVIGNAQQAQHAASSTRSKLNTQRAPLHGWRGLLGGNREGGSAEDIGLNTDDEFACPDARLIFWQLAAAQRMLSFYRPA
jgi:hypothetical protein